MAKSNVYTEIKGQKISLSNLEKVLYADSAISKAEIIQYYLSIAEYILPLIKDRPLTLIRFPDGIDNERFYSKNLPSWTPSWVPNVLVGDIRYMTIADEASLIYAINLAALELHPLNVKNTHISCPDQMIFDLDPPDQESFEQIKELCIDLCHLLEEYDYQSFVKTSGSKGLHIYVPLKPIYSIQQVVDAAKDIASHFIKKHPNTSLRLNKELRKDKTLIDIYRNHASQTCVAALSTRAKPTAPVSMPIHKEDISTLIASNQFTIRNALNYLNKGFAWKDFLASAGKLHTLSNIAISSDLTEYEQKRDFNKTTEPTPEFGAQTNQNRYVVHLHNAQNLHYDLRLEENGVLTSWAIPKGLPDQTGVKRIAIQTEAHPIEYLNFEGVIPKGEYGGGEMWVFHTGVYQLIKKETNKYHVILNDGKQRLEYLLFKTKDDQWLVELKTELDNFIQISDSPMLASASNQVPSREQYFFELKWDGIRISIKKRGQHITLISRGQKELTSAFPEIVQAALEIEAQSAILDAEIVVLDTAGAPVFADTISRMHIKSQSQIEIARKSKPAVAYAFDLRFMDGRNIEKEPIEKRRAWLQCIINPKFPAIRFSQSFEDGEALFEASITHSLEGIIAKKKHSKYAAGQRNADWLKIKSRTCIDVYIIGYTKGNNERSGTFGALHIAQKNEENQLMYLGKVGTGFSTQLLASLTEKIMQIPITKKIINRTVEEEHLTVWIEPILEAEVTYASITPNGTLREPVFIKLIEEV